MSGSVDLDSLEKLANEAISSKEWIESNPWDPWENCKEVLALIEEVRRLREQNRVMKMALEECDKGAFFPNAREALAEVQKTGGSRCKHC